MNLFWVFLPPILLSVLWLFSSPLYKLDAIFNLFHSIDHIGFISIQLIPICLTKTSRLFNSPIYHFCFISTAQLDFFKILWHSLVMKHVRLYWSVAKSDTAFKKSNETFRKQYLINVYPVQKILTMMKFSKCPFF